MVYPSNWADHRIVNVCETSGYYNSGKCRIKWAYILAIIGVFDILLLGILALVLADRQATNYKVASTVNFIDEPNTTLGMNPNEQHFINANNINASETNHAFMTDDNHNQTYGDHQNHHDEYSEAKVKQTGSNEDNSFRDFQI